MTQPLLKVWRVDDTSSPNAVPFSRHYRVPVGSTLEDQARHAAESVALEESKKHELLWPAEFRVLSTDGQLRVVWVDRVTKPTYEATVVEELEPMDPLIHVLWQGKTACQDVRLMGYPQGWPQWQVWMSLLEFSMGSTPTVPKCEECWKAAPELVKEFLR
jgi:hypothetical protein